MSITVNRLDSIIARLLRVTAQDEVRLRRK
jgi:hypothetical protein